MDFLTILERFGIGVGMVIIFSLVANRFLAYLDNRADADEARQKSWDDIRKSDNQQWVSLITGLKMEIGVQGLTAGEHYKAVSQDRINALAYQNTTSTALTELLAMNKEMRVVPDGVREANKTLGIIQKSQHGLSENEARRELEIKSELARMNNAMLGIQTAVNRLETAIGTLPSAMQKSIAPILTTLEDILATAKNTHEVIEDLPLTDKVVETVLFEANGNAPHPLTPSPLHEEGELNHPVIANENGGGE